MVKGPCGYHHASSLVPHRIADSQGVDKAPAFSAFSAFWLRPIAILALLGDSSVPHNRPNRPFVPLPGQESLTFNTDTLYVPELGQVALFFDIISSPHLQ